MWSLFFVSLRKSNYVVIIKRWSRSSNLGLGGGKISKLWIGAGGRIGEITLKTPRWVKAACYDENGGWDMLPETDESKMLCARILAMLN